MEKISIVVSLVDCIKTNTTKELTNREWFERVIALLNDFFNDDPIIGRLFNTSDKEDFCQLTDFYDIEDVVTIAGMANYGYVIAGENIAFKNVTYINEDNYWDVLAKYTKQIENRIKYLYYDKNYTENKIEDYLYPCLNINKLLHGNKTWNVHKTICGKNTKSNIYKYETRSLAIDAIKSMINNMAKVRTDYIISINEDSNEYMFKDRTAKVTYYYTID